MSRPLIWEWVRAQDLVWLGLFVALAITGPVRTPGFVAVLFALAIFQIAERRIGYFSGDRGSFTANLLKMALGFIVVQQSGGLTSSYYWTLLIPVVSAATTLGVGATMLFTVLACGTYLSFLLLLGPDMYVPSDQVPELAVRVLFFIAIGYLTQRLAEAHRLEARRAQEAAAQLAKANEDLKEAEAAVRRSERLAALGQLSGGLAHELRNPLGTIRASAEMLRKNLPEDNDVASELAGFIATEVDRANSLVTRFLEFAKPLELRRQVADLAETIDRAIADLERRSPPCEITVYRNYSPDVRPFAFDAELMERVFYNLILNAAQASPPGGAVTVKTRVLDGMAEVSIIDRGSGIDAPDIENIFNPFFTTKKDGVGLGLAIVSKIVDLHDGTIKVESERGRGSVFRVFLPIS
ncbi:MAG: two-component system sensor histidine kinase NtrB [bacterium]